MRLFIAIDIPEAIKDSVVRAVESVRSTGADVRWVAQAGMHLTLKFLGEVDDKGVDEIKTSLANLTSIPPTSIRVTGAGAFPGMKNPRVLWIGLQEPSGRLAVLQRELEDRLEACGFPREDRPFHPHLTVGRVKSSRRTREMAEGFGALRGLSFGEFPLEEVILFKSDLKPSGAVYTKLFTVTVTDKKQQTASDMCNRTACGRP